MADTKTGALVVVRGHDDIDRLIDGGVQLDAIVSVALLYSAFDHNSAGHDGVSLIESARAKRFAVHLQIACSDKASEVGKRHHATIGLSEAWDA